MKQAITSFFFVFAVLGFLCGASLFGFTMIGIWMFFFFIDLDSPIWKTVLWESKDKPPETLFEKFLSDAYDSIFRR